MASVDMGRAEFAAEKVPCTLPGPEVIDRPVVIAGTEYRISCVSMGNPHCVVFCPRVDGLELTQIGPQFENAPFFPERVNTEFVRVVNAHTLKMRVYERGSGETWACGTGACAAVAVACRLGFCPEGEDITVKVRGGDLLVNYTPQRVILTGDAAQVYEGRTKY